MKIIDSDKLADHGIQAFFFPGGEPHVRCPPIAGELALLLRLRTWNDVGIAMCLLDVLNQRPLYNLRTVFVPYFPGARQDKHDDFTPRTLLLMSRIIDPSCRLFVFDPHSAKTVEATASIPLDWTDINYQRKDDVVGVISPDKGATPRAAKFAAKYYPGCDFIQCDKKRNFQTGEFEGFSMPVIDKVGRYIIVDDICDGGGTFNLLANEFKRQNIAAWSTLELVVSHGIFSKGLINLDPRIDHITTTDSISQHKSDNLTVVPLLPEFQRIIG